MLLGGMEMLKEVIGRNGGVNRNLWLLVEG